LIADKGGAAEAFGVPPSTLRNRMKKLGDCLCSLYYCVRAHRRGRKEIVKVETRLLVFHALTRVLGRYLCAVSPSFYVSQRIRIPLSLPYRWGIAPTTNSLFLANRVMFVGQRTP
jgi:hypothetical protein